MCYVDAWEVDVDNWPASVAGLVQIACRPVCFVNAWEVDVGNWPV